MSPVPRPDPARAAPSSAVDDDRLPPGATWWQRLVFTPATAFDLALTRVLVFGVAAGWFAEGLLAGTPDRLAGLASSWDPISWLSLVAPPPPAQPWATAGWAVGVVVCLAAALGLGGRGVVATAGVTAAVLFTIPESYGKVNHFQNVATMAVLVLAVAPVGPTVAALVSGHRPTARSWRHRWPVVAVRMAFALMYVDAGLSKLLASGWTWVVGPNLRTILVQELALYRDPALADLALVIASHPVLWTGVAAGTLLAEVGMVLAVVGPTRWIRAAAALAGATTTAGLNLLMRLGGRVPMVLVLAFLEWERLARGSWRTRAVVPAAFLVVATVDVVSYGAPRHALSALVPGVLASLVVLTARPIEPAGAGADEADVTTAQEPIASHTPNQ